MPEWWEMYLEEDENDWEDFDLDCYLKRRYPLI